MAGPSMQITLACEKLQDKILKSLEEATQVHVGIIDDAELATIASYQEYGWVQRVTAKQAGWFSHQGLEHAPREGSSLVSPPRPFLRGTAQAEQHKWVRTYANALKRYGPMNASAALNVVGMVASNDVKATLINGGTSQGKFDDRSDLTQELYERQAASHETDGTGNISGAKPLVKTGRLLNGIGYQLS